MEQFSHLSHIFENKIEGEMSFCVCLKRIFFFFMLPFLCVVQPDLEKQQKDGLCDTGVLSATFKEICLNLSR